MSLPNQENIENMEFKKTNWLIETNSQMSLSAAKLNDFVLYFIQKHDLLNNGGNSIKIPPSEIAKALNKKMDGAFYRSLFDACLELNDITIAEISLVGNSFGIYKLYPSIEYLFAEEEEDKKSYVRISINEDFINKISNFSGNYTKLYLSETRDFKKEYSHSLYDYVVSKSFSHNKIKENKYEFIVSLAELKFRIGTSAFLRGNRETHKKIRQGQVKTYEELLENADVNKYQNWKKFKERVLEPSVKEINEKTGIQIKWEPLTRKGSKKIEAIKFTTSYTKERLAMMQKEKANYNCINLREFEDILKGIVPTSDVMSIAIAANGDLSILLSAVEELRNQKIKIKNPTGWLIKYIQCKGYDDKTTEKKKNFANERNYDYDELEKQMLERGMKN